MDMLAERGDIIMSTACRKYGCGFADAIINCPSISLSVYALIVTTRSLTARVGAYKKEDILADGCC